MHWTAPLAYRRFPPTARVIDDLPCISCGYNLRGSRVGNRCPECGAQVGDSLFVLAKSEIVGRSLAGIGKSFLAVFAVIIAAFSSQTWAPMLATGVLAAGAIWRIIHAADLRYRGAVTSLPVIGLRTQLLWYCTIVDVVVSLAYFAIAIVHANDPTAVTTKLLAIGLVGWVMVILLSMAAAGWLGRPFAMMLEYGWMVVEFTVQRISVAVTIMIAFSLLIAVATGAPQVMKTVLVSTLLLAFGWTLLATMVTLLQLSNAAYRSSDTREDAIDMFASDATPAEAKSIPLSPRPNPR